jgi:hypothetical protein
MRVFLVTECEFYDTYQSLKQNDLSFSWFVVLKNRVSFNFRFVVVLKIQVFFDSCKILKYIFKL